IAGRDRTRTGDPLMRHVRTPRIVRQVGLSSASCLAAHVRPSQTTDHRSLATCRAAEHVLISRWRCAMYDAMANLLMSRHRLPALLRGNYFSIVLRDQSFVMFPARPQNRHLSASPSVGLISPQVDHA